MIYTSNEYCRIYHMNCGSVNSHCCSKLCTPLRGEQQATLIRRLRMRRVYECL
nr:MAG TPA: hypothetical protein [Caudoviricetes sp.]